MSAARVMCIVSVPAFTPDASRQRLPRSSRTTRIPPRARKSVVVQPITPPPMIAASKAGVSITGGLGARASLETQRSAGPNGRRSQRGCCRYGDVAIFVIPGHRRKGERPERCSGGPDTSRFASADPRGDERRGDLTTDATLTRSHAAASPRLELVHLARAIGDRRVDLATRHVLATADDRIRRHHSELSWP